MSYLNRFLIEEDTQFECAAVVEILESSLEDVFEYLQKSFNRFSNKSNSDFICHLIISFDFFPNSSQSFETFIHRFEIFPDISYLITRIGSERIECVQKENYEKLYNKGGQVKCNGVEAFEVNQSLGNDIDYFYDRIKMEKNNVVNREHTISDFFRDISSIFPVQTFHLSMLTDEDGKKLQSEDNDNRKRDYFLNKTTLSNKEQNYSLSICMRKTLCMQSFESGETYVRDNKEPDPWQAGMKEHANFSRDRDHEQKFC